MKKILYLGAFLVVGIGMLFLFSPFEKESVIANQGNEQNHSNDIEQINEAVAGEEDVKNVIPFEPYTFDYGKQSTNENGQIVREYEIVAEDRIMNVAGVEIPMWTYNGSVPGPTIRATEGDYIKIKFKNNGSMPHTIHLHGIHPSTMDGVLETIPPGGSYVYEFTAELPGLYLYHCHQDHVKEHINQGMYGAFIIDPKTPLEPATEMVMVMNSYDFDFDGEGNEFYTVNGQPFEYKNNPIEFKVGEKIRIYLVNMTEIDPINSFHIHGNMFTYYENGMMNEPARTTDNVIQGQGQRGIIEMTYKYPGKYMFHAHQSEFSDLGWMGFFNVTE